MTITPLYAGLLALLATYLSIQVILQRRGKGIALGYEEETLLQRGRAFENFTEYVPLALILLLLSEQGGATPFMLHAFGTLLLAGRIIHAYGLYQANLKFRVVGMTATFTTLIGLSCRLIWYFLAS